MRVPPVRKVCISIDCIPCPSESRHFSLLLLSSLQISYGATSVELQNNRYYGKLYSNVPTTASFNYARIAVMKRFKWKRVAILQEYDDSLYSSVRQNTGKLYAMLSCGFNELIKYSVEKFINEL